MYHSHGIMVGETAMREFCHRHDIRPCCPSYRFLRADPARQATAREELSALINADAGECVLLSQDEARFPLVPTLRTTLGVKGQRPVVGTWDNKDLVYAFAALEVVGGQLTTRLLDSPGQGHDRKSKTRRLQDAFAAHLRDIARRYTQQRYPRVVIILDNAPWHRGRLIATVLEAHPHLELYRLPSYSPELNIIERLWPVLRRRATHNRLFGTMAALRWALRASLCYYQTLRHKMLSLIEGPGKVSKTGAA
nr:IS630 family transposase [Halomonas sp.]